MRLAEPASSVFVEKGAQHFPKPLSTAAVETIEHALATLPEGQAGLRLFGLHLLRELLEAQGEAGHIASSLTGAPCRPVRAILFDKSANVNWSLGWHQDRTIAVREKTELAGFKHWNRKAGVVHVEPPFEILAHMVTLRLHLDPVPSGNAPLLIAPGSHRMGRIAEDCISDVVERCGIEECRADRGDIWVYATPILHASAAAEDPRRRRVLQVDYSADDLPKPLEWFGI